MKRRRILYTTLLIYAVWNIFNTFSNIFAFFKTAGTPKIWETYWDSKLRYFQIHLLPENLYITKTTGNKNKS